MFSQLTNTESFTHSQGLTAFFSLAVRMCLSLYHTIPILTTLRKKAPKNIVGKGEYAGNPVKEEF